MNPSNESHLNTLTPGERRRLFFASVGLTGAAFCAGISIILLTMAELPQQIATHWGTSLTADGFGSPWVSVVLLIVVGVVLIVVIYFSAYQQAGYRPTLGSSRPILGFLVGVSVFACTMVVAATVSQVGLTEAQVNEVSLLPSLLIAVAVGALVGVIAGFLAPNVESIPIEAEPVLANEDGTDEFGEWRRSVTAPALVWWIMLGTIALLVAVFVLITVLEPSIWFLTLIPVALIYPLVSCITWSITVSEAGLVARSILGWPVIRIPAASIERVELTEVQPMADFGGWGIRFGLDRRWGIVLQQGKAIQVQRNDGKRTFVATVDDAATGAAILSSVASNSHS